MGNIIGHPLGWIMWLLYQVVRNYGVALILFTLVMKLLLFPVSVKQQKSTAKMSIMAPKQQELQKKYGNNKEKLNEELLMLSASLPASLYRGHKLFPFTSDGKMGVKDYFLGGGKIIQATYDEIKLISGDIDDACFGRKGNRWGLIADYSDKESHPSLNMMNHHINFVMQTGL